LRPRATAPTFSVVIAAYQVADVISDCIESVIRQTLPAREIIVVDDGSTDGLEEVVRPYGDVTYLRRARNGGAAAAMNTGARAATGDYVVFIGSDDVFAPERLEALSELACARPDLDILSTDADVEVNGRPFRRFHDETYPFVVADQRRAIIEGNFVFGHTAVGRERFLAVGGFDETIRWTSDWELWARMILEGSSIGIVDEPLATYRLREKSLSSQRLDQTRGMVATLTRIQSHPSLTDSERNLVSAQIARCRRAVMLGEARLALLNRAVDARRRLLRVAVTPGYPIPTRLRALSAAAVPSLARRRIVQEHEQRWVGAGGVSVPRGEAAE
jgi:hypothetical protein